MRDRLGFGSFGLSLEFGASGLRLTSVPPASVGIRGLRDQGSLGPPKAQFSGSLVWFLPKTQKVKVQKKAKFGGCCPKP